MISFKEALQELNWTEAEWEQRQRESRARTWQNQQRARRNRIEREMKFAGPFNGIRGLEKLK